MKRCLQLFAALALLVVVVSNAHATQTQTTLDVLINNGWNIVAGDKRFDRFSFSSLDGVSPQNFLVTALPDGGLDPGPGLRFNVLNNAMEVGALNNFAGFNGVNGTSKSVTIGFRVTVLDPGLRLKDVSMNLTGYTVISGINGVSGFNTNNDVGGIGQASVEIRELVGYANVSDLGDILVGAYDPGPDTLTNSATFAGRSEIWVQKQIRVFADSLDPTYMVTDFEEDVEFIAVYGGYANLTSFEQRFSQEPIPEPLTAGLGMMGLSALALAATRRRVA